MAVSSIIHKLYNEFYSFEWLGPLLHNADPDRFQQCLEQIRDCLNVRSTEAKGIQAAASPWDAALYLHVVAQQLATGDAGSVVRTLFRGQRSASYRLLSTQRRWEQAGKSLSVAQGWMKSFTTALDRAYQHGELASSGKRSLEALGRHQGIPSTLLDFSTDPSVAVFFACADAKKGQMATVWVLPSRTALTEMHVYLPPPLCKRLYLQRGVFVDTENVDSDHMETLCGRVQFPADPEFRVYRNGNAIGLDQPDPWLDALSKWAQNQAETGVSLEPAERPDFWAALFDRIGYHPGFVRDGGTDRLTAEWADAISDMLYWILWLVKVDEQDRRQETVVLDELEALVRDNSEAMLMWGLLMEAQGRVDQQNGLTDRGRGRQQRAQLIREAATKVCGEDIVTRFLPPAPSET